MSYFETNFFCRKLMRILKYWVQSCTPSAPSSIAPEVNGWKSATTFFTVSQSPLPSSMLGKRPYLKYKSLISAHQSAQCGGMFHFIWALNLIANTNAHIAQYLSWSYHKWIKLQTEFRMVRLKYIFLKFSCKSGFQGATHNTMSRL